MDTTIGEFLLTFALFYCVPAILLVALTYIGARAYRIYEHFTHRKKVRAIYRNASQKLAADPTRPDAEELKETLRLASSVLTGENEVDAVMYNTIFLKPGKKATAAAAPPAPAVPARPAVTEHPTQPDALTAHGQSTNVEHVVRNRNHFLDQVRARDLADAERTTRQGEIVNDS
jgi:hypothetical protein